jgi:hypothetical protein
VRLRIFDVHRGHVDLPFVLWADSRRA